MCALKAPLLLLLLLFACTCFVFRAAHVRDLFLHFRVCLCAFLWGLVVRGQRGSLACISTIQVGSIDGSTAGLVITYALNFTLSIVFTVRLHAQMEMSVNSIERLDEYCKVRRVKSLQ